MPPTIQLTSKNGHTLTADLLEISHPGAAIFSDFAGYFITPSICGKIQIHPRSSLLGWMFIMLQRFKQSRIIRFLGNLFGNVYFLGAIFLIIALIAIFGGYFWTRSLDEGALVWGSPVDFVSEMFSNFGTEFLSIAITVLIIDVLNRRRQRNELKAQLTRDLGSESNDFALRAVQELRVHKWLTNGSLRGAYLGKANLEGADLTDADLGGSNLGSANLKESDLTIANLERTSMWGANLEKAWLWEADLEKTSLWEANLERTVLGYANMREANLQHVNLRGADLKGADLKGAQLWYTDLREANLQEVDLREARLQNNYLQSATYNNNTQWPEDFDPKAAGAINVDEESETEGTGA